MRAIQSVNWDPGAESTRVRYSSTDKHRSKPDGEALTSFC
jgi:hypothetical protein